MKILNWFFSGFFRTIGRTLAILFMGAILYYILVSNDIDFGVKDLFFDKVNASTFSSQYLGSLSYRNGANSSTNYSMSLSNDGFWTTNLVYGTSGYSYNRIIYVQFPSQVSLSNNKKELSFQIKFMRETSDGESDTTGTRKTHCDYHYIEEVYDGRVEPVIDQVDCNETGLLNSQEFQSHFSLSVAYTYNQNDYSYSPCYAKGQSGDNFTFTCPVTTNNISGLKISTNVSDIDASQYRFGVYPLWSVESDTTQDIIDAQNQNTQAITNQTQQQHQDSQNTQNAINNGVNKTIETITQNDLNDTEIEDTLQFSVPQTSLGPFSGFIALPITWIQNILAANQVCYDLQLPLPFINTTLDLPCMSSFWQQMGVVSTLIQLCWLAVVGVRIFNGLYLLVVDIKSPSANADQLTKIRSWEL